jgi:hypothetical protein
LLIKANDAKAFSELILDWNRPKGLIHKKLRRNISYEKQLK